jgi:glycosyltransferase involved in cell wall biosynthesis
MRPRKLHIVTVAYERPIALRILVDCFLVQTNPNWDMTIVHDGKASAAVKKTVALYKDDPRVKFIETKQRVNNWGYSNRRKMLQLINGEPNDFVLLENDDNYHHPRFVEFLLDEVGIYLKKPPRCGMIYYDFLHHNILHEMLYSKIAPNQIDMAAFIVELKLAQEVGFNHEIPLADAMYAMECAAACKKKGLRVHKINKCLLIHN